MPLLLPPGVPAGPPEGGRARHGLAAALCLPGAEDARTQHGDPGESLPGFEEFRETFQRESRQRSEARTDALKAARRAAPGKTRDEIRNLYISELRARGLEIPPESLLEAAIDMLNGDPRAGLRKIWKTALRTFTDG